MDLSETASVRLQYFPSCFSVITVLQLWIQVSPFDSIYDTGLGHSVIQR